MTGLPTKNYEVRDESEKPNRDARVRVSGVLRRRGVSFRVVRPQGTADYLLRERLRRVGAFGATFYVGAEVPTP